MMVVFGKALALPAKNPAVGNNAGKPMGVAHPTGTPANRPAPLPQVHGDSFHKQVAVPQFGKKYKSSRSRMEDKSFVGQTILHGAGYGSQKYLGDRAYGQEFAMRSERGYQKLMSFIFGGSRKQGPIEYAYYGGSSTKRR